MKRISQIQKDRVLLIGSPLSYKLVDFELLRRENIDPILSYSKEMTAIPDGISVYYDSLSVKEVDRIIQNFKIQFLVCFNDNFLIQSAQLRTKYNLPGIGYPEIKKFKIKSDMYRLLSPNLSTPKTIQYDEYVTFCDISKTLGGGEYFIKPDNLAGAEGSCHLRDEENFHEWRKSKRNIGICYLIQRYYSDPLYHCELVVKNNKIRYIQARRYSYPNHKFLEGKIIASFPVQDRKMQHVIERESIKVQKVLGFKNGVMHTEFFVGNDFNPVFLETNIRQAGGGINLVHKRRAGISLETLMILIELNREFEIAKTDQSIFDLCGYIPLKKGLVTDIDIPMLKGHYEFDIRVQLGSTYHAPRSASNTAVSFVGFSKAYGDLLADFSYLERNDMIKYG